MNCSDSSSNSYLVVQFDSLKAQQSCFRHIKRKILLQTSPTKIVGLSTEVTKILTDDIQDLEVEVEINHLLHEKNLLKVSKGPNQEVPEERKTGTEVGVDQDPKVHETRKSRQNTEEEILVQI